MSTTPPHNVPDIVIVDYDDLVKDPSDVHSLSPLLEKAYGASGSLGVLAIRNVPDFLASKRAFLPMAHTLAHLPPDYLEQELTDASSMYNAGWSHGKEKLGEKPDYAKGSFYFNPLADEPGTLEDRAHFPGSYPCNKWPDRIPYFEANAKQLGTLMKDVVVHLSKHLDAFAHERNLNYAPDTLYDAMKTTEKAKGRLLYYFPLAATDDEPTEDSWIGWHNDSGYLTALAGDLYVNDDTGEILTESPDPTAGLYVVDRQDQVVHVSIPCDCMAVQMGECVQILTGGAVVATPHCVRGAASNSDRVARISLPCFIDLPPSSPLCMPSSGCTREQVLSAGVGSSRVPPLAARWTHNGMLFGDFLQKTFSLYYEWSSNKDE